MILRGYMAGITEKKRKKIMGPFQKNWGELEQAL
jgi:ribosome modulation factor